MTVNGLGKIEPELQQNKKLYRMFLLDAIKRAIFKTIADGILVEQGSIDAMIAYERYYNGLLDDVSTAVNGAYDAYNHLKNLFRSTDWISLSTEKKQEIGMSLAHTIYRFMDPYPSTRFSSKDLRLETDDDFKWVNSNYGHLFPNPATTDTFFIDKYYTFI